MTPERTLLVASFVVTALLALSGAYPYDRGTWLLEVFPILIALPVMPALAAREILIRGDYVRGKGRSMGHAVRYVHGARRRDRVVAAAFPLA